jgi:hypothetical protein
VAQARRNKKLSVRASSKGPWSNIELLVALEAYLYVFRLRVAGVDYSESQLAAFLLGGPLSTRNEGSIRYRMRNISFVLQARGLRFNENYSPASQVGAGVHARLSDILNSLGATQLSFLQPAHEQRSSSNVLAAAQGSVLEAAAHFDRVEKALRDLESDFVGIGHNQPPDEIKAEPFTAIDIRNAADDAQEIKQALTPSDLNIVAIQKPQSRLTAFGLRLAVWLGGRVTKFADAAAVALGSIAVAKATNVLPLLIDALQSLARLIGH